MFDFTANETTTDINGVPAEFRPMFVEDSATPGTFKLAKDNPIVAGAVKALTGLATALGSERKITAAQKEALKGVDLSELKDFGATPAEIKAAVEAKITELTEAASKGLKINPETLRAEFQAAHGKEIQVRDQKLAALTEQFKVLTVDQAATMVLTTPDKDGRPMTDAPNLVLPFIRQQVQVVEEDGQMVTVVVNDRKEVRHNPATGQRMTVSDLALEMKEQPTYAPLFRSETRQGPPNPGKTNQPVNPNLPQQRADMSPTQLISAGLAKNQVK
jgi:hypothetical protein